jgi:hypothetical protein
MQCQTGWLVTLPFELQAHGMQSVVDYNNGKVAQVRCFALFVF